MNHKKQKAYTLVETMMVVVIFAVMSQGLYLTLSVGIRSWKVYSSQLGLRQEIRRGMTAMTKELRHASGLLIEQDDNGVTVNFQTLQDGIVSYTWRKDGEDTHKIVRKNYDKLRTLANDITLFQINMPTDREIDITLANGDDTTLFLNEKIAFRMKTKPLISGGEQ